MSKELTTFKKDFQNKCSVKVVKTVEESQCPHWKRLAFHALNCEEMLEVSNYIKDTFSVEGKFSHKLPTLHEHNGYMCLTVDGGQIRKTFNI